MFSSISKYSPKSLLASFLSQSLAQFFNVDPNLVETNLIQDAKVVLNDIEINERRLGGGRSYLRVSGSIKQIEFAWVWDGSSLIKDVRLTVKGVSVHVSVIHEDDGNALTNNVSPEEFERVSQNIDQAPSDWKQKYMQQVIDHLTLAITDVTITIHLNEESHVVLQAKDMELATLPSESNNENATNALMQTISLASVETWIQEDGDVSTKHPILEPFGYQASVTRISGRRFLDGVLSGLLVEGQSFADSSHAPSTIRVHAGIKQIAGLNRLQQVLLLVGQEASNDDSTTDGPSRETEEKPNANSSDSAGMKSTFHLPFQSMEVVLENKTNLRLASCNINYCTDGSELSVDCSGGVWVDDVPFSKDSRWILDFASSELLLDSIPSDEQYEGDFFYNTKSDYDGNVPAEIENQSHDEPFRMDLSLNTFQRISKGFIAIIPQCTEAKVIAEKTMNRYTQPSSSSLPWTMRSTGPVSFRFTGKRDDWVEILMELPAYNGAFSFECASIDVNSNVGFAVHVPHITTNDIGCLLVEHRITATVNSIDTFKVLQNMWSQVVDVIGDESSSSSFSPAISLAGLDITLKEPQFSTVHLSRISVSGMEWSIGVLQVNGVGNVSCDASSLQVTLDANKTSVFVQRIKRLSYNKVDYLVAPIDDTTVLFENDTLSVSCKEAALKIPEQAAATQNDCNAPQESLAFPVSFHLSVDQLRVHSNTKLNTSIGIEGLSGWIRPTAESLVVDIDLKSTKVKVLDMDLSCGTIKTSVEIISARGDEDDSEISLPGLGQVSSASMTIHDVAHLSTTMGYLTKPLDVVEITYGGRTAMVKCDKLLFCPKQSNEAPSSSISLPIDLYIELNRLVIMKEFGPGKPGLCCDGLRVHLTPNETTIDLNAQCNYIQGRGENQADCAIKGLKLNLRKNLHAKDGEFLGLKEAHLSLKEISTMSIPGKLKLAQPICNAVIQLNDLGQIKAALDLVHVTCTQSGSIMGTEDQTGADFVDLPTLFNLEVKRVIVDAPKIEVVCNQFSTQYVKSSTSTSKSLHVGVKSFNGKFGTDKYEMNGVSISTKWQGVVEHGSQVAIPYLGSLSFAQAEVETCTEMSTNSYSLIKPLTKPKLLFQEGFLVFELAEIQLYVSAVGSDPHTDKQSKTFDVDTIQFPIGFNTKKLRLKTPDNDFQLENLGVDYVPSTSNSQVDMHIHCDSLVERMVVSATNLDLHLHLKRAETQKSGTILNTIPGMECVDRASLKIDELSKLFVDGKGRISQPIRHTTISYQDGIVATDIEAMQLECLSFEQSLVLGLRKLNVRIQSDPFDMTFRIIIQCDTVSGHQGDTRFGATGVSLVTTIVPTTKNNEVQVFDIPSLGYASLIVLDIDELPILSIQNTVHLKSPISKLALRFDKNFITMDCPKLILHRSMATKASRTKSGQDMPQFELPCKARILIGAFQLYDPRENERDTIREIQCTSLNLTLEPLKGRAGQVNELIRGPGLRVQVIGSEINSKYGSTAIDIPRISVSGILQLNDLAAVGNLAIGIEKAQIAAEFSSNWSGSIDKGPSEVIKLPFATVPKFELTLHCVGQLVNINDAAIACGEFQGSASTTSSQLVNHYVDIVKGRIPFLMAKADVAGCNLGDSMGVMAGKVLTRTSVVGATVGIASRDAIGSTLTMGKQSRGAAASDKYQFGDFSRGVVNSVKHAANTGSEIRGDNRYQVGDFTTGTAQAAGNYASENRCRLAGAGGSAMGMAAGAALLGPVGFIAGSLIGGSAAKSSMAALTGDPKKDQRLIDDESQYSARHSNDTTQQKQNSQVPDLLSYDNAHYNVSQEATTQQLTHRATTQSYQQNRQSGNETLQYPAHYSHNQGSHRVSPSAPQASSANNDQQGHRFGAPPQQYPHQAAPRSRQQTRQSGNVALQYPAHYSHNQGNAQASPTAPQASSANNDQQGYRFGDVTRGVIARGKKAEGRDENSGYKFGDFTRGLFK